MAGQVAFLLLVALAGGGGNGVQGGVIAHRELLGRAVENGGQVANLEVVAAVDLVDGGALEFAVCGQAVVGGIGGFGDAGAVVVNVGLGQRPGGVTFSPRPILI